MFFVGLDLGQKQDYSAVAVVEREEHQYLRVRHLERMALGTPYTGVVKRVGEITRHPALARGSRLVVDATGVGAPVVELLRAARLPCRVTSVTITGGASAHGSGEEWQVPKQHLMTGLLVLLEEGKLSIPRKLGEAATLVRELTDIRVSPKTGGRAGIGAEGNGEHDDLAMAVALACWRARKMDGELRIQGRLPGI